MEKKPEILNGFLQQPKQKIVNGRVFKLEHNITHRNTTNIYKIKELQEKGLIAVLEASILKHLIGQKVYIRDLQLDEYVIS